MKMYPLPRGSTYTCCFSNLGSSPSAPSDLPKIIPKPNKTTTTACADDPQGKLLAIFRRGNKQSHFYRLLSTSTRAYEQQEKKRKKGSLFTYFSRIESRRYLSRSDHVMVDSIRSMRKKNHSLVFLCWLLVHEWSSKFTRSVACARLVKCPAAVSRVICTPDEVPDDCRGQGCDIISTKVKAETNFNFFLLHKVDHANYMQEW